MDLETHYRCPGEAYEISRSVHLGRLASFHAACGKCPHRSDTATFSVRRIKLLQGVQRHSGDTNPLFHAEGIAGTYLNEIDSEIARRVGKAFGVQLTASAPAGVAPRVVIGNDGRPWTAELAVAVADGLRWSGCSIVDLGAATAPCLTWAAERHQADGALLVGNSGGAPREVGLALWGAGGEPMSSPGALDGVRDLFYSPAPRPRRTFGVAERLAADAGYLAKLETHYHALRPLRLVVDTTSLAIARYLQRLTSAVAVEICCGIGTESAHSPNRIDSPTPAAGCSAREQRFAKIAERVRCAHAHFGIWIDGDGEACRVIDERGELVVVESLVVLIAREVLAEQLEPTVMVPAALDGLANTTSGTGARITPVSSNRQAIWQAMVQNRADFAADQHGRIWFAGRPICADALKTLTLLLTVLSRSDRPLSERVESAIL